MTTLPRPPYLLAAAWLLPIAAPPLVDGAVRVDPDGRLGAVGPRSALSAAHPALPIVDLGPCALLPGLVNVHAHPELTLLRHALEDLPLHSWIPALRARTARWTPEDFDLAARWGLVEALRAGITTVAATEASGASAAALREAGLRGVVYVEAFGPDPARVDDAWADLERRLAAVARHASELVRMGVSPHAPYSVSDALYRRVAATAAERDLDVATHIAESAAEVELVRRAEGPWAAALRARGLTVAPRARSPVDLLARTGVLERAPLLVHAVHIDEEDTAQIAASGARVAHCPVANAKLGHGVAPVPELLGAGVRLGLGTDSVAANNRLDLLDEGRAATLLQRARCADATLLPARQVLRLLTLGGAEALGWADRIGSLEPGKDADLCAVRLDGPHVRPVADVEAALVHAARASDVVLTMVRGRPLYDGRRVLTLDEAALADVVERRATELSQP